MDLAFFALSISSGVIFIFILLPIRFKSGLFAGIIAEPQAFFVLAVITVITNHTFSAFRAEFPAERGGAFQSPFVAFRTGIGMVLAFPEVTAVSYGYDEVSVLAATSSGYVIEFVVGHFSGLVELFEIRFRFFFGECEIVFFCEIHKFFRGFRVFGFFEHFVCKFHFFLLLVFPNDKTQISVRSLIVYTKESGERTKVFIKKSKNFCPNFRTRSIIPKKEEFFN